MPRPPWVIPAVVLSRSEGLVDKPDIELLGPGGPVRDNVALLQHLPDVRRADVIHIHEGVWLLQSIFVADLRGEASTHPARGL